MMDSFKTLSKLCRYRRLHIDGYVFRLHCTLTVLILMAFVIINSTKQIVGEPIACNKDRDIEDQEVINNWCYVKGIHSNRFRKQNDYLKYRVDGYYHHIYGIYRGLGQPEDGSYKPNVYYQWIWFMLLFQAICFYFPRWLWKGFENDKMSSFVSDLNYFTLKKEDRDNKVTLIVDYLYLTNGTNDWYAIKYFFCELLALINVCIQMIINNIFLSDQYYYFGWNYIQYLYRNPSIDSENPLDSVFPILSKCNISRFGISGQKEKLDFLCVLTINVFNQKIYLFCWFWFIFLIIFLSFVIIFRLFLICCPLIRYYCCRFRFELSEITRRKSRRLVANNLHLGDWFILYLLGQNIEPIIFCEIIEKLCEKLEIKSSNDFIAENFSIEDNSKM